jgi:hypothetical protein
MLKIGMGLISHIEPILKEVVEIKGSQTHGKQELIESNGKSFAIYREIFENDSDANHFVEFCNQVYAMKKDDLPPIHILITMFKTMLPILTPKKLKGKQAHGKPEVRKMEDGTVMVILKESFTEKEDAQNHLEEATKIKSMRI